MVNWRCAVNLHKWNLIAHEGAVSVDWVRYECGYCYRSKYAKRRKP